MVTIKWCLEQSKGPELVDSNENMSKGYINLADSSLGTMNRERNKNNVFSISAGYYSMYYSLYSVLINIGIKCEIHQCSIKIMQKLLNDYYSNEDMENIYFAFKLRNNVQYYVDKILKTEDLDKLILDAPNFVAKSREILSKLNETKIKELREKFKQLK
jgi:uncharacterized protein (UPF0332 family)